MLPNAVKYGRYISPLFFQLSFCCCWLCLCANLLRRSRNMGFRNMLLKMKAFYIVVTTLKLMIKDLLFFFLVNVWINFLINCLLVMSPNSDFNISWPFPTPFNKTSRASRSWMSKNVAIVGWKEWTEAQKARSLTVGLSWSNFELINLIMVSFRFSKRLQ